MRVFSRMKSWLRTVLRRERFEKELCEELRFHLECRTRDLKRSGLSHSEAERRARREFGDVDQFKKRCRGERGLRWPDEFQRNLGFALRVLAKSPTFAASAIVTLGLCIGANTAIFSVVDSVLLESLPYEDPERLMLVATRFASERGEGLQTSQPGLVWENIRDHAKLSKPAVFSGWPMGVNLARGGDASYVMQSRVGASYFDVLGVAPAAGRAFSAQEDRAGGPPATILSHQLCRRIFGDPRAAVGERLLLRGQPHTVVGVMPRSFQSPWDADLWTPLRASRSGEGGGANYSIVVRLNKDVGFEEAQAEISALGDSTRDELGWPAEAEVRHELIPLKSSFNEDLFHPLVVLWAAVILVLVIGCVNIAGLMLARLGRRSREMAIRLAMGGGRAAIMRQMLTESALLASLGGLVGLALGHLGKEGFVWLAQDSYRIWQPVDLDWRVMGATALTALAAILLFGLAPALRASRVDVRSALAEGSSRGVAAGVARRSRQLLVVAQVALGVVLLVSAGLLVRTFIHLRSLDPGFETENILAAKLSLQDARYEEASKVNQLFQRSLQAIRAIPGVESAAVGLTLPYERALNSGFVVFGRDGQTTSPRRANVVYVTPGYFETLRIPVLRGRAIDERDRAQSQAAAMVNRSFAERYLGLDDAVGATIGSGGAKREVVGIVGDVQHRTVFGNTGPIGTAPTIYYPAAQMNDASFAIIHTWFSPNWIVRTPLPAGEMASRMRQAIRSIDPLLPFADFRGMGEVMSLSWARERLQAALLGVLAGLALLLAAVGIYGLIANSVLERQREMGIRMAVGADRAAAVRIVAMPGIRLASLGIALGCLLAWGATRLLGHLLTGVGSHDPLTFAAVSALLLATAALASLLPSLRVTRWQPADILRGE